MRLFLATIALTFSIPAAAEPVDVTRVLKDTTTLISLPLNEQTVFCTDRGYGNVQLKVSVPDLDWLAHFDHRVFGEGVPCITGGACTDGRGPSLILDAAQPLETVPIRVVLSEHLTVDADAQTCTRILNEKVTSLIRRHKFDHYRSGEPETVPYAQCAAVLDL